MTPPLYRKARLIKILKLSRRLLLNLNRKRLTNKLKKKKTPQEVAMIKIEGKLNTMWRKHNSYI